MSSCKWMVHAEGPSGPVVKGYFSEREHAELIADRLRWLYTDYRTWVSEIAD
jgi:hypothetical protein